MKIGYFSSKFPYQKTNPNYPYGGSVIATYNLALEMKNRDHDVNIFTTANKSKDEIEELNGIKIYRYASTLDYLSSNISINLFFKPYHHNVDIVHGSFDIPPLPLAGLKYAKEKKLPYILTYHGDWDESYGNICRRIGVHLVNRFSVEKLLDYANYIISPSKSYINNSTFLKKYSDKIVVIPNGINLPNFDISYSKEECRIALNIPCDKKIILFLGFLSPYKGPINLLFSLQQIIKTIPDVFLIFVGEGVLKKSLEKLTIELNLKEHVKFYGYVEEAHKALFYRAADIFCLPSIMKTECFPITILESMATGTPIIASKIGGIPDELSDNIEGKLVEPNDICELTNAFVSILDDDKKRRELGENCRKKAQQYSWEHIAYQTNILYEKTLSEK